MSNLSEREVLYHLLQIVLIDIRAEAYKAENSRIFQLSNLFHNLPLQFIKRDRGVAIITGRGDQRGDMHSEDEHAWLTADDSRQRQTA